MARVSAGRRAGHAEGLMAQLFDLIAQLRGLFELQVAGVLVHLGLELFDALHGLLWRQQDDRLLIACRPAGLTAALRARAFHDVLYGLADRGRRDAVRDVVFDLLRSPAIGFVERPLHRARHAIGVQDCAAVDVARGATDGLDQRTS